MKLKNRTAIITGGGRGLGRGISLKLAAEGAAVIIADIDEKNSIETVDIISAFGGRAEFIMTDVTDSSAVENTVNKTIGAYKKIDILVNNAGTDIKAAVQEFNNEVWDKLMDLNLKGVYLMTKAVSRRMIEAKSGRIINISSIAGKVGEKFTAPYCTTKFGLIGFTQSVAMELGPSNITVNAVCPGPVDTELIRRAITETAEISGKTYDEVLHEKYLSRTPLGRIAQPEDVANVVAFCASDEASFITGSAINVSGGLVMH